MTTFRSELAEPYSITPNSGLAAKLAHFFMVFDGKVIDAITGAVVPVEAGVTVVGDKIVFDGTSSAYIKYTLPARIENPSFYGRVKYNVGDVDQGLFGINSSGTYSGITAWADTLNGGLRTRIWASIGDFGEIGALTVGDWHNWGGSANATTDLATTWHNGIKTVIDSPIGARDWENKDDLYLGSRGIAGNMNGEMEYFALFNEELTDAEFRYLNADPYAMFQPIPNYKPEYCLVSDNATAKAMTLATPMDVAANDDFTLEIECTHSSGYGRPIGETGVNSSSVLLSDTGIYIALYNSAGSNGNGYFLKNESTLIPERSKLKFVRLAGMLSCFIDGVQQDISFANTEVYSFKGFLRRGTASHIGNLYSILFSNDTSGQGEYFSFNKTKGDTVTSETSNNIATLVNFPVDSGYVRGVAGNVGGYQLGTDIITVTLSGAYSGIITYMDGSTLDVSGSGNYVFDSAHILPVKEFNVTDTLSTYQYDFTTGDKDQIIETISNNHATITSASTSKWQPVVIKDIFTIGTGKDYPSPQEFKDARKSVLTVQVGVLYEMFDSSLFQYGYFWGSGWRAQNEFIAAKGMEYKGNSLDPNNVGWKDFNSVGSKCFGSGSINATGLVFGSVDTAGEGQLVNSYASGVDVQSIGTLRLRDSCVTFSGGAFQSGTVNATNSIIRGRFNDNDNGSTMNADSCVFPTAVYGNTVNTFNAKNSQFAGTNEYIDTDGGGNAFSIDMSTWFVDEANNDFKVTASGQTALAGQGWGGTNIAQWAYLAIAVLIEGSLTSNTTQAVVVQGIKVTAGALEGTLTITISSDSTSTGAKLASAELIEPVVLTYNIQALKAAAGTSISNIPSASTILGYKAASGTSISSIGSNYSTDGLKGATGDVTNTLTFTNTETGKKIMSEVIQVMNTITSDTAAIKVGISSLEESLSAAIPLQGVKNTSGTAISDVIHSISIIGQKIVVGVAQGFIEIDLVSGTNTTGTKGTSGVISTELNMGIILETLKLMEGSLQEAVSSETLTEGIKNTSGLTISAHTIIDTLSAYKSAGNILPIITNNSIVETEGTKGSTGTLVELGTILVELEALASKSGDIELAHEIADLIVGVNTDTTHIQRLNVVLGTLNIRYSPISGIVSSKSIQGVV